MRRTHLPASYREMRGRCFRSDWQGAFVVGVWDPFWSSTRVHIARAFNPARARRADRVDRAGRHAAVRSRRARVIVMMLAAWCGNASSAAAAEPIRWRSGAATIGQRNAVQAAVQVAELVPVAGRRHLVVQFDQHVGPLERKKLASAGIRLLKYVGANAFFAVVDSKGFDSALLDGVPSLISGVAVGAQWKLHPILARGELPAWAKVGADIRGDPVIGVYVLFHADASIAPDGSNLVERYGGTVRAALRSINGLVVELPQSQVAALAAEDIVQYIEPALPMMGELNDSNRALVGADVVSTAPYNLDGTGITALVYDAGSVLATHVDFGGRVTDADTTPISDHATHVSCTLGGSGSASGGTWAGMAPGVNLVSYGFEDDGTGTFLYTNPGDLEADYTEAINTFGADLANNSIGTNTCANGFACEITGDYGVTAALIDAIVRGSLGAPFRILWANGNERACTRCQTEGFTTPEGYHSTVPPSGAKNHVSVGAVNSNDDTMTNFSSWGPTDDGRLKPDIVAPGCQTNGDFGVTSCSSLFGTTTYSKKCGTSMATPTVTGMAALLLQDFRAQFPTRPDFRNSTLKILLAHNAVDLGNPGPDYQAGYGSVRIEPTIDFMRAGSFLEDSVGAGGVYTTLVVVNPGDAQLKIMLAWDDVPGTPNVDPALVNDLDLRVFSPSSTQHFPWTLDPLNPANPAVQTQADHINNIEQVLVNGPQTGVWVVEVLGFNVPVGPQPFSLSTTPALVACSSAGTISLDRVKYACDGVATIQVVDCDLNTNDAVVDSTNVTIVSDTEPVGESLTLIETAADTGVFRASIPLSTTNSAGVLGITSGDQVVVTYTDADDGSGGLNLVLNDTAVVDCQLPVVSNVQTGEIATDSVNVTFDTDEPTTAGVQFGLSCAALNNTVLESGFDTAHSLSLTGLSDDTMYYYTIDVEDEAGNALTDDNGGACYSFSTQVIPDFFTEIFAGDNDLSNTTLLFVPNGSPSFYAGCSTTALTLPTDPTDGTVLALGDDSSLSVSLSGSDTVSLYGTSYATFHVGSNGYITFGSGDTATKETLASHFSLPRISGLFDDLNPGSLGTISWKQLSDRVAVTWDTVPEFGTTDINTFQIEMLFDGRIRVTYLTIDALDGLAGLSEGTGLAPEFTETDLTAVGGCLDVTVELEGVAVAVSRDVTFVMTECAGPNTDTMTVSMGFSAAGLGSVVLPIANPTVEWISADENHSLPSLIPLGPPLPAGVAFTGTERLVGGDFTGDQLIDIRDFSVLAAQWDTAGVEADISGDLLQNLADFDAIKGNFGLVGEPIDGCVP